MGPGGMGLIHTWQCPRSWHDCHLVAAYHFRGVESCGRGGYQSESGVRSQHVVIVIKWEEERDA